MESEIVTKLKDENEQLWAQVARMQDEIKQRAEKYEYTMRRLETQNKALLEQLTNIYGLQSNVTVFIPADCHNPADVKMLKKVKEMLHECMAMRMMPDKVERVVNEALAEINRTIGGKEDV